MDLGVAGGAEGGDGEGHGDAVVVAGVDLRAVELLVAGDVEAVLVLGEFGAHGAEIAGDEGDAVGLFDAELFGVADAHAVAGVGRDGGEDGELVDELGGEGAGDVEGLRERAGAGVGVDLDGADEFAVVLFDVEDLILPPRAEMTSSRAARVGFMPRASRTRLESGKRRAAQRKKAAEERSPGTVASMAWSCWPPGMLRRLVSSDAVAERVRVAPKAWRACSEWSRVRMDSERRGGALAPGGRRRGRRFLPARRGWAS